MKVIRIETKNTSYRIAVSDTGHLLHLYYGKKVYDDMDYLLSFNERGLAGIPYDSKTNPAFSPDVLPMEFPCYGCGDYRSYAFNVRDEAGVYGLDLRYEKHYLQDGKYKIPGLPAVYTNDGDARTLKIELSDTYNHLQVILCYGILYEQDVITRSVIIKNAGELPLYVSKLQIATLDFMTGEYDFIHFYGRHMKEQNFERTPVMHGMQRIGSRRGTSSHQHNPYGILAEKETTEDYGNCYGMLFLYSGNYSAEVELDQFHQVRFQMGMLDEMMDYRIAPGDLFYSPEVAMAYSDQGLTRLSHIYHNLIRNHVCRGRYKNIRRPIIINNWEATYFDFTGEKIMEIARWASELGIEMFVLDDGWFGKRDSDKSGLGDWIVNENKIGCSMGQLSDKIHSLGMKFGLWIEPEMVNEDSGLYREHPEWVFSIPGRQPVLGRNQLVLDFSRKEAVDYILGKILDVVTQSGIEYIKMDMNRSICDVYSAVKERQNFGEIMHKYVLGVYDFLERLMDACPDVLIEGCSSGGGRFDAGMLYYTPQIWCSDDTDAVERVTIQYGNSFAYPISTVGSHISAVPNHQTGRVTGIHTRSAVAMAGNYGFELDPKTLSEAEKEIIRDQIKEYKKYWNVIHNGNYYRVTSPLVNQYAVWNFSLQEEALLCVVLLRATANEAVHYARCKGLIPSSEYYCEQTNKIYSGAALQNIGIPIPIGKNDYSVWMYHFVRAIK